MCVFAALKQKIVALGGVAWYRRNVDEVEEVERLLDSSSSALPWATGPMARDGAKGNGERKLLRDRFAA